MVIKLSVMLLYVSFILQVLANVPEGKWYTIKSIASQKCLYWDSVSKEVKQVGCNESQENQKWEVQVSKNKSEWYYIKNSQGKVFDIQWGSRDNKAKLWVYDSNKTPAQNFKFENRNGSWLITNKGSAKCIDVPDGKADDNLVINQFNCNGLSRQLWEFSKIGEKKISTNPNPDNLPLDKVIQLKNSNSQKCLYTHSFSHEIKQKSCNSNDESQKFKIVASRTKPGIFNILNIKGKALDVQWGSRNNGGKIWEYDQNFTPAQDFEITIQNGWQIKNTQSAKCLDNEGSKKDDDITLIQWDCHNGINQRWEIIPQATPSNPSSQKPSGQPPSGQQPPQTKQPSASGQAPSGQQPGPTQKTPSGQQPSPNQQTPSGQQPTPTQQTPSGQQPTPTQQTPSGQQPTPTQQTPSGQQPTQTPSGQQPTDKPSDSGPLKQNSKPNSSGIQPDDTTNEKSSPAKKLPNLPPKLTQGMYSQKGHGNYIFNFFQTGLVSAIQDLDNHLLI